MTGSPPTPPAPLQLLSHVNASPGTTVSCMGIVCDFLEPSNTRGNDMQQTFQLIDHSVASSPNASTHLRVKFFCKQVNDFPPIRAVGDVVLLRNVNIRTYQGQVVALASYRTTWTVFPGERMPGGKTRLETLDLTGVRSVGHADAPPLSLDEARYAVALRRYIARSAGLEMPTSSANPPPQNETKVPPTASSRSAPRDKFALIRDIRPNQFYNLAVRVIKKYPSDFHNVELFVTDYTSNKALYNYSDDARQQDDQTNNFPPGFLTLKVDLMPPHSQWAEVNVKQNDFVLLQNVRVKTNKVGHLEGNIWHDSLHAQRIYISALDRSHPRALDLFARRKAHDHDLQRKSLGIGTAKRGKNKTAKSKHPLPDDSHLGERTSNAKKVKVSSDSELNQCIQVTTQNKSTDTPVPLSDIIHFDRTATTPHGHTYTLPFVNFRAYTNVRVVDYYPHALEQFAVRVTSHPAHTKWDWHFILLLEEAETVSDPVSTSTTTTTATPRTTLPVLVAGADAQFLLNLDAADLTHDTRTLDTLRERLFLLWGDLEEHKSALLHSLLPPTRSPSPHQYVLPAPHYTSRWPMNVLSTPEAQEALRRRRLEHKLEPTSRPFTCCIGEYGVRNREWRGRGEDVSNASDDDDGDDDDDVAVDVVDVDGDHTAWIRCHRLFGTTIRY